MFRGPTWSGSIQQALIEKFWVAVMSCDTSATSPPLQKQQEHEDSEESDDSDTSEESEPDEDSDTELDLQDTEGSCALVNRFDLLSVVGVRGRYHGQAQPTGDHNNGTSSVTHLGTLMTYDAERNVLKTQTVPTHEASCSKAAVVEDQNFPTTSKHPHLPNSLTASVFTISKWRKSRIPKLSSKFSPTTCPECDKCQVTYTSQKTSKVKSKIRESRSHSQSRIPVYINLRDLKGDRGSCLCRYHASRPLTTLISRKYHSNFTRGKTSKIIPQHSSALGGARNVVKPQTQRNIRERVKLTEEKYSRQRDNKIKRSQQNFGAQGSRWTKETRIPQKPTVVRNKRPSNERKQFEKYPNKVILNRTTRGVANQPESKGNSCLSSKSKKFVSRGRSSVSGLISEERIPQPKSKLNTKSENDSKHRNSEGIVQNNAFRKLSNISGEQVNNKNPGNATDKINSNENETEGVTWRSDVDNDGQGNIQIPHIYKSATSGECEFAINPSPSPSEGRESDTGPSPPSSEGRDSDTGPSPPSSEGRDSDTGPSPPSSEGRDSDTGSSPPLSKTEEDVAIEADADIPDDVVNDMCLEQCLREAILGVVQELPEGWILVPEHTAELFSSVTSLLEAFPRQTHAHDSVVAALMHTHTSRPCHKGDIPSLNNAHLLLYVTLKLCCTTRPVVNTTRRQQQQQQQHHLQEREKHQQRNKDVKQRSLVVKTLEEIQRCEGSFDRLLMCVLLGSGAPGRGSGWYCHTDTEDEKTRDLIFLLDHLRLLPGCRVSEVISAPLWWCGSTPVVVAALAESPQLVLTLLQYGAGGSHLHHHLYSKCYTNGVYLAIAYLLRKLEKQLKEGDASYYPVAGADGVLLPSGGQRKGDGDLQEPRAEGLAGEVVIPASYSLALSFSHASTAICLRYLYRSVPCVPAKFLRDQVGECEVPTLLSHPSCSATPTCLPMPTLLHLSRIAIRSYLRDLDLLPHVLYTLQLPSKLADYLNLLTD